MVNQNIIAHFNEIYNATYKPVLAYITAKCGNTADIQDIVQETYVELYTALEKRGVDYIENEKAFCLRIAKQKLSRHYTVLQRLRMIVPMTATNKEGDEIDITDFEASEFIEQDFTVNHILLDHVRKFLSQKPQDVKKAFYLFYDVGLSISEISAILKISESSVKNKLYRTINELRILIK